MLRSKNFKLDMMIVHVKQMTPINFGVNGSKEGQGRVDLVGKNGFRSRTEERSGLGTSNLV
jgi:hypothetical protein